MHALLLFTLASAIASKVLAGRVVQFPSIVQVRAGESVKMSCQLDGVRAYCYTVAWLRVNPNSGTLAINKHVFWGKNHTQSTVCPAIIHSATPEDSGTYYCAVTDKQKIYTGNGTSVFVEARISTAPSVEVIRFSSSSAYGSVVPVQCLVKGAVLSQVQVYWTKGVRREHGQTDCVWADGEVFIVSQMLLRPEECERREKCACVVKHEGHIITRTLDPNDLQDSCYAAVALQRALGLLLFIAVATAASCSTRNPNISTS